MLRVAGSLRVGWPIGMAFIPAGTAGMLLVMALQFGLILSIGVFNPVYATYRLEQTDTDRVARTLSAWQVSSSATIALTTALWGLLAGLIGLRAGIALAGLLALPTPLLLSRRKTSARARPEPAEAVGG